MLAVLGNTSRHPKQADAPEAVRHKAVDVGAVAIAIIGAKDFLMRVLSIVKAFRAWTCAVCRSTEHARHAVL